MIVSGAARANPVRVGPVHLGATGFRGMKLFNYEGTTFFSKC